MDSGWETGADFFWKVAFKLRGMELCYVHVPTPHRNIIIMKWRHVLIKNKS